MPIVLAAAGAGWLAYSYHRRQYKSIPPTFSGSPEVITSSVDPGWVPTKMGGPSAPDDLELGHLTQAWLAVSQEPRALQSGQYWHHQQTQTPHPSSRDPEFQRRLLENLERVCA